MVSTSHYSSDFCVSCCNPDFVSSGGNGFFTFQCIFEDRSSVHRSTLHTLASVFFPFALALIISVAWTISAIGKKQWWGFLSYRLFIAVLSVVHYFYIDLTKNLLGIFNCTRVDTAEENEQQYAIAASTYWVPDTDVECYRGEHLLLLLIVGVPFVMSVVVGLPLGLLISLLRGSGKRKNTMYAFLYRAYKGKFQHWEVIIMLRKALLAVLAVFAFSLGPILQSTLAMGVLFIALSLNQWKRPFIEIGPNLNVMEDVSISCSFLVFFTGTVFNDENTASAGNIIASIVLIASLVGTILYLLLELAKEAGKKHVKAFLKKTTRLKIWPESSKELSTDQRYAGLLSVPGASGRLVIVEIDA